MARIENFSGRVAVVTGGASGIGRGMAEALVAAGAQVVIADIEQAALDRTAGEIGAAGIRVDVSKAESVQSLADDVVRRFGRVDILCNNAGVGSMARVVAMTLDDWQWMLGVNLWGAIHGVRSFLPHLIANPDGAHIVNTASIAGLTTMPMLGPYSVSKFAVVALTEALAIEMAQDHPLVGATVFAPGPVRSNLGKSQRNRPVELADVGLVDVELDDVADQFGGPVPWVEPRAAGDIVLAAIRTGKRYVTTHPEWSGMIAQRHADVVEQLSR